MYENKTIKILFLLISLICLVIAKNALATSFSQDSVLRYMANNNYDNFNRIKVITNEDEKKADKDGKTIFIAQSENDFVISGNKTKGTLLIPKSCKKYGYGSCIVTDGREAAITSIPERCTALKIAIEDIESRENKEIILDDEKFDLYFEAILSCDTGNGTTLNIKDGIIDKNIGGICRGLSVFYLYCRSCGLMQLFDDNINSIIEFNNGKKLTKEQRTSVNSMLQDVLYFQNEDVKDNSFPTNALKKRYGKDFELKQDGMFLVDSLEYTLVSLKSLLSLENYIQNDMLIMITLKLKDSMNDVWHATAVVKEGEHYVYFDPNHGEQKVDNTEELAKLIFQSGGVSEQADSSSTMLVRFCMICSKGAKLKPSPLFAAQRRAFINNPYISSIMEGNIDQIKNLLSNENDKYGLYKNNVFSNEGANRYNAITPFGYAIASYNSGIEIIKEFIKSGKIDLNELSVPNKKMTPLMLAICHDRKDIALELIKSGARLDLLDEDGKTIFEYSGASYSYNGCAESVIKELLATDLKFVNFIPVQNEEEWVSFILDVFYGKIEKHKDNLFKTCDQQIYYKKHSPLEVVIMDKRKIFAENITDSIIDSIKENHENAGYTEEMGKYLARSIEFAIDFAANQQGNKKICPSIMNKLSTLVEAELNENKIQNEQMLVKAKDRLKNIITFLTPVLSSEKIQQDSGEYCEKLNIAIQEMQLLLGK